MARPRSIVPTFSLAKRGDVFYVQFWWDGCARRISTGTWEKDQAQQFCDEFRTRFDPTSWRNAGVTKRVPAPPMRDRFIVGRAAPVDLMPVAQILSLAVPTQDASGIYFLIQDGEVVYVGQASNVLARVGKHASDRDFDAWTWLPVPIGNLTRTERAYIDYLRPRLNRDNRFLKAIRRAA